MGHGVTPQWDKKIERMRKMLGYHLFALAAEAEQVKNPKPD